MYLLACSFANILAMASLTESLSADATQRFRFLRLCLQLLALDPSDRAGADPDGAPLAPLEFLLGRGGGVSLDGPPSEKAWAGGVTRSRAGGVRMLALEEGRLRPPQSSSWPSGRPRLPVLPLDSVLARLRGSPSPARLTSEPRRLSRLTSEERLLRLLKCARRLPDEPKDWRLLFWPKSTIGSRDGSVLNLLSVIGGNVL